MKKLLIINKKLFTLFVCISLLVVTGWFNQASAKEESTGAFMKELIDPSPKIKVDGKKCEEYLKLYDKTIECFQ